MMHYKIVYGFGQDDYLPITENELPKAIALFIEGKGKGLFLEGAVRGQDVQRIVPDWHRAKGWNKGYKMLPEDYHEISPLERAYNDAYSNGKLIAEIALKENRRDLLTQTMATAMLSLPKILEDIPLLAEVSSLAEKFKV